jgi:hypothetical protein
MFTAKLGRKYRDFPFYYLPLLIHSFPHYWFLLHWYFCHNWGFYTHMSLFPGWIVYIIVDLGVKYFMGLDKCRMTYYHNYSVIQNTSTALKSFMFHLFISPFPYSWLKQTFYCLHNFVFFKMSFTENNTEYSFSMLTSFT